MSAGKSIAMDPARLEVVHEGRRQEVDLTKGTFTIGRASDNDLVLSDRAVSKYHARLLYSNRGWKISDLGSANGTYVDGERLFALDSRVIEDGSSIRIGDVYMVLHMRRHAADAGDAALDDEAVSEEMARLLSAPPEAAPAAAYQEPSAPSQLNLAHEVWHLQMAMADGVLQEFPLTTTPFLIGRSRDAGLPLTGAKVSKSHAQLVYSRGAWQIVDLGSSNGTIVEEELIPSGAARLLADGSRIQIGDTQLTLRRYVWQLQVTLRSGRRQDVELSRSPFRIGRADTNDLVLNEAAVSDQHAELSYEAGAWRITDLDSASGTHVENQRLQAQYPRTLMARSTFQIGGAQIVLNLGPLKLETEDAGAPDQAGRRSPVLDSILDDISSDTSRRRRQPEPESPPDTPPAPPVAAAPAVEQPAVEQPTVEQPAALARAGEHLRTVPLFERMISSPLRHASERLLNATGLHSVRYWLRDSLGVHVALPDALKRDGQAGDDGRRSPQPAPQAPKAPAAKQGAPLAAPQQTTMAQAQTRPITRLNEGVLVEGDLPLLESSRFIYLTSASDALIVNPGQAVSIALTVMNRSTVVDRIGVHVVGLPSHWITVTPEKVPLLPNDRGDVQITITPPRDSSSLAGLHHFAIVGYSEELENERTVLGATLTIMPFSEFRVSLRPRQQGAWRKATYRMEIANLGNQTEALQLRGYDDEDQLRYDFDPDQPIVAPGRTRNIGIEVRAPGWRWFGMAQTIFFTVNATALTPSLPPNEALVARNTLLPPPPPAPPQETQGRLVHQALFSVPLLIILALILLALLAPLLLKYWASAFQPEPTPTVVPVLAGLTEPLTPTATLELPTVELPTPELPTLEPLPTDVPLPTVEPPTLAPLLPTIEPPTPVPPPTSVPPTPTPAPPTAVPTPQGELTCVAGHPVILSGTGPPRAPILLYFDTRAVGGGRVDDRGNFELTLLVGEEAPGSYPVTVRERATSRVLLLRTCVVPRRATP